MNTDAEPFALDEKGQPVTVKVTDKMSQPRQTLVPMTEAEATDAKIAALVAALTHVLNGTNPKMGFPTMDRWTYARAVLADLDQAASDHDAAVEDALIARIVRLNRGEDYDLAVRMDEARALLDGDER